MSIAALALSKEETFQAIADLRRAAEANEGKIANLQQASDVLTGKFRELRNLDTANQTYTPAGQDAELLSRYTLDADVVTGHAVHPEHRGELRYADDNRPGAEYLAGKSSPKAVRMLSEWDELGNCSPGLLDDPEPVTPWQHRTQQLMELRSLGRIFLSRQNARGQVQLGATPKIDSVLKRHFERGPDIVRQVFADNASEGADFIPDVVLAELSRRLEMPRNVVALFPTQNIPTGGTTSNPFLIAGCQPFIVGTPAAGDLDPADIMRSVPSSTSITTSPKTWGVSLPASRDATEDSIIEWAPFAQLMLAEAVRDGEEDGYLNADLNGGDTGLATWNPRSRWNTLGSNLDHRKSYIGLRAHSFDASSAGSLAVESAVGILAELIHMDSPQFMDDVVGITSPEWVLLKLLTDSNLLTVDKYGSLATLLTGEIGSIGGKRIVMSEFVDVQYNASGIFDDATKTKTGFLWVNRNRWATAQRRGPRVEAEVRPSQHLQILTLTQRRHLRHLGRSTEKSVTWQYNASTS